MFWKYIRAQMQNIFDEMQLFVNEIEVEELRL